MALLRMMAFTPSAQLADVEQTIRESVPQTQNNAPVVEPPCVDESPVTSGSEESAQPVNQPAIEDASEPLHVDAGLMALDAQQQAIEAQAEQMRDEPSVPQQDNTHTPPQSEDAANLARTKAMLEMQQRMFQQPAQEASEDAKKPEAKSAPPVAQSSAIETTSESGKETELPPWENSQGEEVSEPQIDSAAKEVIADYADSVQRTENTSQQQPVEDNTRTAKVQEAPAISAAPSQIEAGKELPVFLDNGEKLVSAAQIDTWASIIESLNVRGLVKQVALNASFEQNDNVISLLLQADQEHLLSDGIVEQLQQALSAHFERAVEIDIQTGQPEQTPFGLQQRIEQMRQAYAHSVVEENEAINQLLTTFNASVVTETVKPR
jgi:DNA polymerase-3 subunit gamma/tau